ncbi:hypothetical protein KUTeg_008367 [Tegillarca granosa]|uniref:Uncharacterized protein n=1 Tax=Tegillarca granosa TaxID=220873 RepID=A0ABQ9F8Y9_TEGGR|nr:hypothetical protein KUTeg_008367 [Tegillarca granosa]
MKRKLKVVLCKNQKTKSLRCLRNRIHSHLIVTFILSNTVWFIMEITVETIVTSDLKLELSRY